MDGVAEEIGNPFEVVGGDPDSARPAEDVAVLLAGAADGRRVDDGHQFGDVLDEQAIEEGFVAVVKGGEPDELLQIITLDPDVLQLQGDLLLDGELSGRQQALELERPPLVM